MTHPEAVKLLKHHQNMLSQIDGYTPEYMEGLLDPNSPDYALLFSQALDIVLNISVIEGYLKAS